MKRTLTHAACLLAGVAFIAVLRGGLHTPDDDTGTESATRIRQAMNGGSTTPPSGKPRQPGQRYRSSECRAAWKAIAFGKFTVAERIERQRAVLREWATTDLQGAMKAALAGAWDGWEDEGGIDALLESFNGVFIDDPQKAWDIMGSGDLGLGAAIFRKHWLAIVSKEKPLDAAAKLDQFDTSSRMNAFDTILDHITHRDPALRGSVLAALADLNDTEENERFIKQVLEKSPATGTPEEMKAALLTAPADGLKRTLALTEYASSLRDADGARIKADWESLPPGLRRDAARTLHDSETAGRQPAAVIDLLIASDQWGMVTGYGRMRSFLANGPGTADLPNWALTLPRKPDIEPLFRAALSSYFGRDLDTARIWVDALPAGDWRKDQALLQLTETSAIGRHPDPAITRWAVDQITDPQVKNLAGKFIVPPRK